MTDVVSGISVIESPVTHDELMLGLRQLLHDIAQSSREDAQPATVTSFSISVRLHELGFRLEEWFGQKALIEQVAAVRLLLASFEHMKAMGVAVVTYGVRNAVVKTLADLPAETGNPP